MVKKCVFLESGAIPFFFGAVSSYVYVTSPNCRVIIINFIYFGTMTLSKKTMLCRRHPFWSYPAGLAITDLPG